MQVVVSPKYQDLVTEIDHIPATKCLKEDILYDGRNQIRLLKLSALEVVVKVFAKPKWIQLFFLVLFRTSKAERSYSYSQQLLDKKIIVPEPIAYLENYFGPFLRDSYYVCAKINYDFNLHDIIAGRVEVSDDFFRQFGRFTYEFHQSGFLHLDYTPGNILVEKKNDKFVFKLVDLNRMKIGGINILKASSVFGKIYFSEDKLAICVEEYAKCGNLSFQKVMSIVKRKHQSFERQKRIKKILRFYRSKS